MLDEIVRHEPITTDLFVLIEAQSEILRDTIAQQIEYLINLSRQMCKLNNQIDTMQCAMDQMDQNSKHENNFKINAIPVASPDGQAVQIDVLLYDNIARHRYYESEMDGQIACNNYESILQEIKKLRSAMHHSLTELSKSVLQMRQTCDGFNFISEFSIYLHELQSVSNEKDESANCVEKILRILECCEAGNLMQYAAFV